MSVCRFTVAAQTEEVRGSRTRTPEPSPAGGGDKPHTPQPVIRLSQTLHHSQTQINTANIQTRGYAGMEKASRFYAEAELKMKMTALAFIKL